MIVRKLKINCPIRQEVVSARECIRCGLCLPPGILKRLFKDIEFEPNRYGVTELVTPCIRRSYFARKLDKSYTLKDLYILGRGRAFHSWFNEFFSMNEVKVVKRFKNFSIVGIVDALEQTEEGTVMYEIKSVTRIPKVPYPHHVTQLQAYYSLARETFEVDRLVLVYLSMNDFTTFQVEKKDVMKDLYRRARILHNAILKDVPPPIEDTTTCFFCPFRSTCQLYSSVQEFKNNVVKNKQG